MSLQWDCDCGNTLILSGGETSKKTIVAFCDECGSVVSGAADREY
jgi:hypothetical protein